MSHGFIPEYLGLVEIVKVSEPLISMLVENLFKTFSVILIRHIHILRDLLFFLISQDVKTAFCNIINNLRSKIKGYYRYIFRFCKINNFPVKIIIISPPLKILGFFQKILFGNISGD